MSSNEEYTLIQNLVKKDNFSSKLYYVLKNTTTGKIIILFWIMYAIQFILYPIFIGPVTSNSQPTVLWSSIFTVSSETPHYIWTYIISIFSHGGLFHILLNTIVLFSFGVIIENDFGKKKFIQLFLIFGVLANISQLLIVYLAHVTIIPLYISIDEFMLLGASGAISSFIGIVFVRTPGIPVKIIILPFFSFKLMYGVVMFILGSLILILYFGVVAFNIAHTAHIFGLLMGIIYGVKIYGLTGIKYEFIDSANKLILNKF